MTVSRERQAADGLLVTCGSGTPLLDKIHNRSAVVAVLGLGYVGLPTAVAFAEAGFEVVGLDVDQAKVGRIRAGESGVPEVTPSTLRQLLDAGSLRVTGDFALLAGVDCALICVPTPLLPPGPGRPAPDLSYVRQAAEQIATRLHAGQLVVLESTTYAGTTEEVVLPILERSNLSVRTDFYLGYAPEREDPGNARYRVRDIPRVVSGYDARSRDLVTALYSTVSPEVRPVSSMRAAELTKIFENSFRSVNIALVNELKMFCDHIGLDVWEVIGAAASKPFGFMPFQPGPGVGGHCIPIDPLYLAWHAAQLGFDAEVVSLASRVNLSMPGYVVGRLRQLEHLSPGCASRRVLVVGVAYKRNIADVRESPSIEIIRLLQGDGAVVDYHDPHVPELATEHGLEAPMESVPLTAEVIAGYDLAVVVTDHDAIDWRMLADHAALILDTRNAIRTAVGERDNVVRA